MIPRGVNTMSNEKHDAWDKLNTTRITIKYNNNTDADILEWLAKQPSKAGAIKQAIREAMKKDAK